MVEALVGKKVIGTADEGIAARPPLSLILIFALPSSTVQIAVPCNLAATESTLF